MMPRERTEKFLQRFGKISFLFFLVKGLLWLIVPAILALFFGAD